MWRVLSLFERKLNPAGSVPAARQRRRTLVLISATVAVLSFSAVPLARADINMAVDGTPPYMPQPGDLSFNDFATAAQGGYIRIFVPWDTFGTDNKSGGCTSGGADSYLQSTIVNDVNTIENDYHRTPLLALDTPYGQSDYPASALDEECAIEKMAQALSNHNPNLYFAYIPIEPFNEPECNPTNGCNTNSYWLSPGWAAYLYFYATQTHDFSPIAGVFHQGGCIAYSGNGESCPSNKNSTGDWPNSYEQKYINTLNALNTIPSAWSFHDYYDPKQAYNCDCATALDALNFQHWESFNGLGSGNTWITESANTLAHSNWNDDWEAGWNVSQWLTRYATHVFWYQFWNDNANWDGALDANGQGQSDSLRADYCGFIQGGSCPSP